jgi:Leucine-rich repeat (LRR) protein
MAQKTPLAYYDSLDNGKTYTSLQEALKDPQNVYRLKLIKLDNRDSLPEELFSLTELRELTVKGCKLCVLNQNIDKLAKLESLNLDKNKLVRLPETIGNLQKLKFLCVSRNLMETFPESISKMTGLTYIDAWDNPLYILPESIKSLQKTLKTLDLRQIPLTKSEFKAMQELLPFTEILFTDICECENRRDHN